MIADCAAKINKAEHQRQSGAAEAARRREHQREHEERAEQARVKALHKAGPALRRCKEIIEFVEKVLRSGRIPNDRRKKGGVWENGFNGLNGKRGASIPCLR